MSQTEGVDAVVAIVDVASDARTAGCRGLKNGLVELAHVYARNVEDYPAPAAIHIVFMDAVKELADRAASQGCITTNDRAFIKRLAESVTRQGFVFNWPDRDERRVADRADISLSNVSRIGDVSQLDRDEFESERVDYVERVEEAFEDEDRGVRTR